MIARLATLLAKARHYATEIGFTRQLSDDLPSRLRLSVWLLLFHLHHLLPPTLRPARLATITFRLPLRLPDGSTAGVTLRPFAGDLFVLNEIFLGRVYRLPAAVLAGAETLVDLGANIGLTSLWLGSQIRPTKVVCVEPNARNIPLLRANLSALDAPALVVAGAVARESGSAYFRARTEGWGGLLTPGPRGATEEVPCFSMASILQMGELERVDILKIDIEGAEAQVLADGPEWLARVNTLIIEIHSPYSVEALERDLTMQGMTVLYPEENPGTLAMIVATREPDLFAAPVQ